MSRGTYLFSTDGVRPRLGKQPSDLRPHLWKTPPTPSVRPVISVGNLAMGGRGKTPVAIEVARILVAAGERPAVLSRGYKRRRREDGVVIVSDGRHVLADIERSGDEPMLIAQRVPGAAVLVCEQRATARAFAETVLGATVHVLDDGFQHRQLGRDVDLVIVSARDLTDRPLPFGKLRESLKALRRADAIISEDDLDPATLPDASIPRYTLRRSLGDPIPLEPDQQWPAGRGPVVAAAGIAEPARFTRALEAAGWTVARSLAFSDHQQYSNRDLATIAAALRETGAAGVVTTDKDAVRLLSLRPLPVPIAAVPLEVAIEPAGAFASWLLERVRHARS